jgi:hypothetical protein
VEGLFLAGDGLGLADERDERREDEHLSRVAADVSARDVMSS